MIIFFLIKKNTMQSKKIFSIKTNRSNISPALNLKDFIINLLSNIVPNAEDYVKPQMMPIWNRAFISEIVNPSENYEEYEYLGDRVPKTTFALYMHHRYPHYTPQDITNIDMIVMAKKMQYDLSFELGLLKFINLPEHVKMPIGVGADVFESFQGALDQVSESIMTDLGNVNSYNLMCFIFNQNEIPVHFREGSAIMYVEQIFRRLRLPELIITVDKVVVHNKFQIRVTLTMDPQAVDFFNQRQMKVPTILASWTEPVKNDAQRRAHEIAKEVLIKAGITDAFIENIKNQEVNEDKNQEVNDVENKELAQPTPITFNVPIKDIVVSILKNIIKQPYVLNRFVTPENLANVWNKVFTDIPDEHLTFYGEVIIKGFLAKYLWYHYTDGGKLSEYTKDDFNNMMSHLNNNYSLFLTTKPLSYIAHCLEAFIGAVDEISNKILPGSNLVNDMELIKYIFKPELIPYNFRFRHPKTEMEQLLSPFLGPIKAKPLLTKTLSEDKVFTLELSLTPEQFDFLRHHNIKIIIPLLATASGTPLKTVERETYRLALETLKQLGVTKAWSTQLKRESEFKTPLLSPYYSALEKQRQRDQFEYLYFASPSKTTTFNAVTIQLVGVRNNEKVIVASRLIDPKWDRLEVKMDLVKDYLQK